MENDLFFRIVLIVLIGAFIVHRGYYHRKYVSTEESTLKKRDESRENRVAQILGVLALAASITYVLYPKLTAFAFLVLPSWLRSTGVAVAILGFALLQWAQNVLGRNWSGTPRMTREQRLVVSGPYQWVRHPIYTAFVIIFGSTLLISANWLIGFAWLGMTAFEIASRIGFEESLMIEYFGNDYREYMNRTGKLLPKFI